MVQEETPASIGIGLGPYSRSSECGPVDSTYGEAASIICRNPAPTGRALLPVDSVGKSLLLCEHLSQDFAFFSCKKPRSCNPRKKVARE